jgi:hypothetical protein
MLKVLDKITLNRLHVAEHLQNMDPNSFDMARGCYCIGGQTLVALGIPMRYRYAHQWEDISVLAAEALGLTDRQAHDLFCPEAYSRKSYHSKDAARVMRYLAATGEVDWSVGGPPVSKASKRPDVLMLEHA